MGQLESDLPLNNEKQSNRAVKRDSLGCEGLDDCG